MVKKIQKHIEIVRSTNSGFKSLGRESADAIQKLLKRHYASVGISIINSTEDLELLVGLQPDLVFIGMKYIPLAGSPDTDKVWITEYLDQHDIAYTGSGHLTHKLELDKQHAKQTVLDAGLKSSPFYVVKHNELPKQEDIKLQYPLFVKPTSSGGGMGIDDASVVTNFTELITKTSALNQYFISDTLIEEYLPGREFSVAILEDEFSPDFFVMPLELIAPLNSSGVRILSAEIKKADTEQFIAVTDQTIRSRICALALDAFQVLGAQSYGRIDIRLDQQGVPHFLEANLVPSLIKDYGNFPKACKLNRDMEFEDVILSIVHLGFARAAEYTELESEAYINSFLPSLVVEIL